MYCGGKIPSIYAIQRNVLGQLHYKVQILLANGLTKSVVQTPSKEILVGKAVAYILYKKIKPGSAYEDTSLTFWCVMFR